MTSMLQHALSRIGAGAVALGVLCTCGPAAERPGEARAGVTVAAASDLRFALDELVDEYLSIHPETSVRVTYGSSGNFYAQVLNQAPFDLYLSADIEYPRQVAAAGLGLDEVFQYGVGRIVVWVPSASSLDLDALGIEALSHSSVQKIAIANPAHAPYGRAAVAALQRLGVHARVESRFVLGDNISQTAQFVQSGAADIGVIALALALAPEMRELGRYWEIPLEAYPTMEQGGVITRWATDPEEARRLRDFLLSDRGREVLKRYGFSLPERG